MRLSIITTMYNSAKYLPKCVGSLLEQDIPADDYEIILVNDGSPDNSLEVAREYARAHKNIKVLSHPNKGLAGARNTGLLAATGEYLCFVDPDDYVRPNIYGKLLGIMDEKLLDMLRFNYNMVDEEYKVVEKPKGTVLDYSSRVMDGESFMAERLGYACFVWSYIYRLSFLRNTGVLYKEGAFFDDTNWLPRVCCEASRVDSLDEVCYYYLQRPGSLLNAFSEIAKQKKILGQKELISNLSAFAEQTESVKVKHWCKTMISATVLAVMSTAVEMSYKDLVKQVSAMKVFPLELGMDNTTARVKRKVKLINQSPVLYYHISRLTNFIKTIIRK